MEYYAKQLMSKTKKITYHASAINGEIRDVWEREALSNNHGNIRFHNTTKSFFTKN